MLRAVPVAVVNKWLKNFDENPHRLRTCHALPRRESVMKPRFCRDALPPADKSAAPCCCCGVCCLRSLMHFSGGNKPLKFPITLNGIRSPPNTLFLGPTRVHNPNNISIGSAVLQDPRLCQTHTHTRTHARTHAHTHTHTDHATSAATGRIFALREYDAA